MSGIWSGIESALNSGVGQLIGGVTVSGLVGAIAARTQFRRNMGLTAQAAQLDFTYEYTAYRFSIPHALRDDLSAMADGWDNLFYSSFDPTRRSMFAGQFMVERFNEVYLPFLSDDFSEFLESFRGLAGSVMRTMTALPAELEGMNPRVRREYLEETVANIVDAFYRLENEFFPRLNISGPMNESARNSIIRASHRCIADTPVLGRTAKLRKAADAAQHFMMMKGSPYALDT